MDNLKYTGFIKTKGHDMFDEKGNKILLRSVGLGNWLLVEGYMLLLKNKYDRPRHIEYLIKDLIGEEKANKFWKDYRENYVTEEDIKKISELGFNCVRPAINSRLFISEGKKDKFIDEGFTYIDNLIKWCKQYNIYIVIDMHGAPGGQTARNIDDSPNNKPELFLDKGNREKCIKLWQEIAKRYKDETVVIAYDLLNEPLPKDDCSYLNNKLEPLYIDITKAIRKYDKNHMISLEGANWASDMTVFSKVFDKKIFYQFHKYWNDIDQESIQNYLDTREKFSVPLWCGETGENNNSWYRDNFQLLEDYNIGWSFWPWKKLGSNNCPYTIISPKEWDKVQSYSNGGEKPSKQEIEKILTELIENIKVSNCIYNDTVINAIFRRVPARIQAVNYGHKGYNKSYYVKDINKKALYYRKNEPVSIVEDTLKVNVGWMEAGEWLNFDVECEKEGLYTLQFMMAAPGKGAQFRVEIDGKDATGPIEAEQTGAWDRWKITQKKYIKFKKGPQGLRFYSITGGYNLDWIGVVPEGQKEASYRPENDKMLEGSIGKIPGIIEAECYGSKGEGISYHDSTVGNIGGTLRQDGVDLQSISAEYIIELQNSEWVKYEINCMKSNNFEFVIKSKAKEINSKIEIILDEISITDFVIGSKKWQEFNSKKFLINFGVHELKFKCIGGVVDIGWIEIK